MPENKRLDKTLKYNTVAFVFSISIILLFVICTFLRIEVLATLLYFLFSPILILVSVLKVSGISPPLLIFLYWFFIALIFMIVKDKYRKYLIAVIFVIGLICVISFYHIDKIVICKGYAVYPISCDGRLNQIGVALTQYSMDNDGYFPDKNGAEGLEMLRKASYLKDYKMDTYPSASEKSAMNELKDANISVHYRGGEKYSEENTRPVAWNKDENHNNKRTNRSSFASSRGKNYGNVLLANGSVIHYEGEAWKKFCEENDLSKK